ncbi:hypothetical protein RUND412_003309 [Rhizina undulata]
MVLVNDVPVEPAIQKVLRVGRRRRLLDRISRNSSSPQLSEMGEGHRPREENRYSKKHSVSCISLSSSDTLVPERDGLVGVRVVEVVQMGTELRTSTYVEEKKKRAKELWKALPSEIKLQVFGHLEPKELVRCSSVCKEWHKLCFDGQLWKTLDATGFYSSIPVDQLSKLITSAGPFIRNLNIRGCVQLEGDWHTDPVVKACRNLETVSLEDCKLTKKAINCILLQNPNLIHLNLSGLHNVTNETCQVVSTLCRRIETLNVSWCSKMDACGLEKIVESCKNLKELRASEIGRFDENAPMQALFKANTLEKLILAGCSTLSDEAIRILVEGIEADIDPFTTRNAAPHRTLVHLDLSKCLHLTDAALRHLADNVPNLEGLQLGGCFNITDAGMIALLPTLPKLSHLDLEECAEITNLTLIQLAKGPAAKKMKHLHVSYCENLGDSGISEVLRNCDNLRNLEIDNTRVTDLVLAEAAHAVKQRMAKLPPSKMKCMTDRVALRMVVFDCAGITWTGIREILYRNSEYLSTLAPGFPGDKPHVIQLKCFYGWQMTVDEHTKRVLRGELESANRIEGRWAEHMMANMEAGATGRRRRRRIREAELFGEEITELEFGMRRGRRGGCAIM